MLAGLGVMPPTGIRPGLLPGSLIRTGSEVPVRVSNLGIRSLR